MRETIALIIWYPVSRLPYPCAPTDWACNAGLERIWSRLTDETGIESETVLDILILGNLENDDGGKCCLAVIVIGAACGAGSGGDDAMLADYAECLFDKGLARDATAADTLARLQASVESGEETIEIRAGNALLWLNETIDGRHCRAGSKRFENVR